METVMLAMACTAYMLIVGLLCVSVLGLDDEDD